mmetsp:Transcript_49534/g.117829  ORF Transcript_49534/g.117829 Transcript_49534/m.117829 type:complete len:398 (+) Transcript_49534:264-1457(+)
MSVHTRIALGLRLKSESASLLSSVGTSLWIMYIGRGTTSSPFSAASSSSSARSSSPTSLAAATVLTNTMVRTSGCSSRASRSAGIGSEDTSTQRCNARGECVCSADEVMRSMSGKRLTRDRTTLLTLSPFQSGRVAAAKITCDGWRTSASSASRISASFVSPASIRAAPFRMISRFLVFDIAGARKSRIFWTSDTKPPSRSMSASSITAVCTCSRNHGSVKRRTADGVATVMTVSPRSAGEEPARSETGTFSAIEESPNDCSTDTTWRASSWFGTRMIASGRPSHVVLSPSTRSMIGRRYESVLPDPVSAPMITSLPERIFGIADAWICVGRENPRAESAVVKSSCSPRSANETLLSAQISPWGAASPSAPPIAWLLRSTDFLTGRQSDRARLPSPS